MKANELMIGDWVKPFGSYEGVYAKITSITPNRIDMVTTSKNLHHETAEYTYPIPLTPEILEKNGFVVESRDCHGEPLHYYVLVDGLWIDISGENFFEGKLEYVHQLQHTLRLCGIDKEIEL